jgi:hypothetical protein
MSQPIGLCIAFTKISAGVLRNSVAPLLNESLVWKIAVPPTASESTSHRSIGKARKIESLSLVEEALSLPLQQISSEASLY